MQRHWASRQFLRNMFSMTDQIDKALKKAKFIPDDLDRRIIAHLRIDGRAPVSTIAAALDVARGTVQTRLERLLATGTVMGFTARIRDDYDDRTVRAVMLIEVRGKSTTQVIRRLRGIPEVHMLHTTNGSWDLVAEIRAGSLTDFDRTLREVRMIDGVDNSETSLLLSSV
ncbi:Lrp/AsnC family transcriptional regulator [Flavisphingomonas formosensis]|uniref:Lrp/AsnC family transcriptional regulator n=1 Tax=Flavisphingomonas formosensis TaxID=861534 RepID=UPI001E4D263F|nr:Lrp/AsnC family transcriptional regulator [Sphingomonas formosensis]